MAPKPSEVRLGQYLVQQQWCQLCQVSEALARQDELKARGESQPLGRILVALGHLTEDRLLCALAELGVLHMGCTQCEHIVKVPSHTPGRTYACPRCRQPMVCEEPQARSARQSKSATGNFQTVVATLEGPPDARSAEPVADAVEVEPVPEEPVAGSSRFIGRVLGGCRIVEKIAQGGMGVIYQAVQLNLNRTVAVKVLAEDLADDDNFVRRFIEEARAAGQLSHHNIVHINDVGEQHGVFFFIMEFVDGENLKSILKREGRLSVERALVIALQVCYALRHAHERGIIHRDIKPENVMITRDGVVKLADLGLAKRVEAGANDGLTKAGSIFGTPYYMAPEQAKNFSAVDQRSDIYSLGVTIYKMITGKVPFDGRSPIEIMIKALDGRRPPMSALCGEVPERVERLVDRMMARNPDDRCQRIDEVIQELKDLLGDHANRSRSEKLLTFH